MATRLCVILTLTLSESVCALHHQDRALRAATIIFLALETLFVLVASVLGAVDFDAAFEIASVHESGLDMSAQLVPEHGIPLTVRIYIASWCVFVSLPLPQ